MSENKKIRNATRKELKGITFKSALEKTFYVTLIQQGIIPQYEPRTFLLWEGFIPKTPYYDRETPKHRDRRDLEEGNNKQSSIQLMLKDTKIVGIRYTPDFYFRYGDYDVYIEAKGMENDVFYIKKKLFIKYLDDRFDAEGQKSLYFEVYTKKQLLQAIKIIKNYEQNSSAENKESDQITA